MSEPVDIKIAHINKSENINNVLNKEAVYEIFSKSNFEAIAPFINSNKLGLIELTRRSKTSIPI